MCLITLLGVHQNAADFPVHEGLSDRLSWRRFHKLRDGGRTPDEKTNWEYRTRLTDSGSMPWLFESYAAQMKAAGDSPKDAPMMDASWVPTPKQPHTPAEPDTLKAE